MSVAFCVVLDAYFQTNAVHHEPSDYMFVVRAKCVATILARI